MGLDIHIRVDNPSEVFTLDYLTNSDNFVIHGLSRIFCNLMCRKNLVDGETEFEQIARITSVDISSILAMETYGETSEEELQYLLETAENEEEKQEILAKERFKKGYNEKIKNNVDQILLTLNKLISAVRLIDDLPQRLDDNGYDTLNNETYFSNLFANSVISHFSNNFSQDLRNFKQFVEYAKSNGSTTVYFEYS